MNLNFELKGVPEIKEILDSLVPKHARAIIRNTNYAIAAEVRNDIRARAPVYKGKLRGSVAVRNMRSNPDKPITVVYFKDKGFHWRFVEHGTSRGNRPKPFVTPAVEAMRARLPQVAREKFVKVLEKAIARELKKREIK